MIVSKLSTDLLGQCSILTGHCPLTGRYFKPCMVINKNQRQDTHIASNGIYLEKLGHFVPNLSQSNCSLKRGYAVGIKAKNRAIGKIYWWPGERERAVDPSQAFPLPRLLLSFLRLPLFFALPIFFSFFPQCVAWSRASQIQMS